MLPTLALAMASTLPACLPPTCCIKSCPALAGDPGWQRGAPLPWVPLAGEVNVPSKRYDRPTAPCLQYNILVNAPYEGYDRPNARIH